MFFFSLLASGNKTDDNKQKVFYYALRLYKFVLLKQEKCKLMSKGSIWDDDTKSNSLCFVFKQVAYPVS